MKLLNYKKSCIEDEDIKSNILNYTVLKINYKGFLSFDSFIEEFNMYLKNVGYIGEKELLTYQDVNIIGEVELYENYIEKEPIVRFINKNGTTRIVVTRFFTYMYLDYRTNHKLKDEIGDFNELIKIIIEKEVNKSIIFEKVSLKKNSGVIVNSMNNILDCFETRLFNENSFEINRIQKESKANLLISQSKNMFVWDDIIFNVFKELKKGKTKITNKEGFSKDKPCYEIMLDIEGTIYFNSLEDNNYTYNNFESNIEIINSCIFEIFKLNLSTSFLKDMIKGESNKILKGLNKNG